MIEFGCIWHIEVCLVRYLNSSKTCQFTTLIFSFINSKRHLLIIAFWSIYIYYWSTAITEWSVTFSLPHRHFQVLSCLVWSHCVSRVGLYSLHSEHGVNMPAKIKRRTTFASKTFYFFNQFYLMPLCLHLHLHLKR